jgi:hypothetical protein
MKRDLNKLNVMNYQIDTSEGHWYLCCGLRSLWNFSKEYELNFKDLCDTLLEKGYLLLPDGDTQICMI